MSFLRYLKTQVIPYIEFEHFGIFRFWVMLRTYKQTDSNILPTPTDFVDVGKA